MTYEEAVQLLLPLQRDVDRLIQNQDEILRMLLEIMRCVTDLTRPSDDEAEGEVASELVAALCSSINLFVGSSVLPNQMEVKQNIRQIENAADSIGYFVSHPNGPVS